MTKRPLVCGLILLIVSLFLLFLVLETLLLVLQHYVKNKYIVDYCSFVVCMLRCFTLFLKLNFIFFVEINCIISKNFWKLNLFFCSRLESIFFINPRNTSRRTLLASIFLVEKIFKLYSWVNKNNVCISSIKAKFCLFKLK